MLSFKINEQGQVFTGRVRVPEGSRKLVSVRISTRKVPDNVLGNNFGYGVAAAGENTPAFVGTLTFQNVLRPTFQVTAGAGQKIYFARPTRYGLPRLSIGGFAGGFTYITLVFNGEDYYLFESVNENLGDSIITVIN